MRKVQAQRLIAIGIVIAVGAEVVACRIDALGFIECGTQVEAGLRVAAGQTKAALEGLVAARPKANIGLETVAAALAGENLHDPTDGVRAIERRARAADYFHPLDLLRAEKFQAAGAAGGGGNTLAVYQYQGLRGRGAAHEQTGLASRAAGTADADARDALKQFRHAAHLQALDVLAAKYRGCSCRLLEWFDLSPGGHHQRR
ncbi:hypothetical protein D3C80_1425910 [compost metagenome]